MIVKYSPIEQFTTTLFSYTYIAVRDVDKNANREREREMQNKFEVAGILPGNQVSNIVKSGHSKLIKMKSVSAESFRMNAHLLLISCALMLLLVRRRILRLKNVFEPAQR